MGVELPYCGQVVWVISGFNGSFVAGGWRVMFCHHQFKLSAEQFVLKVGGVFRFVITDLSQRAEQ